MARYYTHDDLIEMLKAEQGSTPRNEFARKIGISYPMYSHILSGNRRADGAKVLKFLRMKRVVVFVRDGE